MDYPIELSVTTLSRRDDGKHKAIAVLLQERHLKVGGRIRWTRTSHFATTEVVVFVARLTPLYPADSLLPPPLPSRFLSVYLVCLSSVFSSLSLRFF